MAGIFIFRTDACLFLGNVVEAFGQTAHVLLAFQQLSQWLPHLLEFLLHLWYREVVRLSHEIGNQLVHALIGAQHRLVTVQLVGHDNC